ncbi:histone-fold-containing protein [Powellomyces hirtus]|nr:histone-fold-containing protein [Powellomyces hirtus]
MTDSAGGSSEHLLSDADDPREQDRYLPTANVARLMKKALPDNSKVAKEAKDCIMECVSEFISFVTSEASDRCVAEKRKTINGEDILWALQSLGFDSYCEVMKVYLSRYREVWASRKRALGHIVTVAFNLRLQS